VSKIKDEISKVFENYRERARCVGELLKQGNATYKRLEPWHEQQLIHFMGIVNVSMADLVRAHEEERLSTLAWITRNLLELVVWIEFATKSDENAKRFQDDATKDLYGWAKAAIDLEKGRDSAEHKKLSDKMSELEKFAQSRGLVKLGDDYMRVSAIAKELGHDADFAPRYKLYSKFAHPTAWIVRTASSVEADADVRNMFFDDGVVLAFAAIAHFEHRFLTAFPELKPKGSEVIY
jgi:hypothetical protein